MPAIATTPVFAASIVARLPLAMLTIGMLVHVQQLTGSFAAAGLVAGTLAVAQGAGGPALGRLVDRRGQTAVLLAGALVAGAGLVAIALLPSDAPLSAMVALATVIGFATPARRPVHARAAARPRRRTRTSSAPPTPSTPPPSS